MKKMSAVFAAVLFLLCAFSLTASAQEDGMPEEEPVAQLEEIEETVLEDSSWDLASFQDQEGEPSPEGQEEQEPEDQEEPSEGETPSEGGPALEPLYGLYLEDHVAYVSGTDDLVHPDDNLRRSEAASLIYQLLTDPADPVEGRFQDVPSGAWYQVFVDSLTEMEILSGMGDNTFAPNRNITRAEFAAILSKLFPMEITDLTFSDVPSTHWARAAIQNAAAKGWVSGYPDGTFRPNSPITRAEAFAMINKMLGRSADSSLLDGEGKVLRFLDLSFDHWAYYHIMEAALPHTHSYDQEGNEVWEGYVVPTAQLGQGPHLVDGQLYYVGSDGYYVRNASVGVLEFNNLGRQTTGDVKLDAQLTSIMLREASSSASLSENLRNMYDYVIDDYSYLAAAHVPQGSTGWVNSYASSMINLHRGNCYSYAALFTLLAQRLGYQATAVSGMVTVNTCPTWTYGNWSEHGWVEIDLNGLIYVCDPQLRDGHAATWGYNWDLFMKPYGQSVAHYRVNDKVLS